MICRPALARDEDQVVEMAEAGCTETWGHHRFDGAKLRLAFRESLIEPNPTFFVAESRDGLVGFQEAYLSEYNFTDGIRAIPNVTYVRPENRGSRAAALLMMNFVRWADQHGAKECVGGNSNGFQSERTAKLLERFGFERVGICMIRRCTRSEP